MLHSSYFIFVSELKYRISIILTVFLTIIGIIYLYNLSFIYQLINFNYLLYFKMGGIYNYYIYYDTSTYITSNYYSGFFFYPEQEYNLDIRDLYSTIYMIETLFFFIMILPYLIYQFILFIMPALYSFEKSCYLFVVFLITALLVLEVLFSIYIGNYLIIFSSKQLVGGLNNAYYTTLNMISLYFYYILIFLGGLVLKVILYTLYKIWYCSKLTSFTGLVADSNRINTFRYIIFFLIFVIYIFIPIHIIVILIMVYIILFEISLLTRVNLLLRRRFTYY